MASFYISVEQREELGTGREEMWVLVPVLSHVSCVTGPLSEPPFPSSVQVLISFAALKGCDSMSNVCNRELLNR